MLRPVRACSALSRARRPARGLIMRTYRAGETVEEFCRVCKIDRLHTIIVVGSLSSFNVLFADEGDQFKGAGE